MKIFKLILRILIITHIFPLFGLLAHPEAPSLEGYFSGWLMNLVIFGILGVIVFLIWVFDFDTTDEGYF